MAWRLRSCVHPAASCAHRAPALVPPTSQSLVSHCPVADLGDLPPFRKPLHADLAAPGVRPRVARTRPPTHQL
eukprot:15246506-Alexandrium_andersonii.AAC.1